MPSIINYYLLNAVEKNSPTDYNREYATKNAIVEKSRNIFSSGVSNGILVTVSFDSHFYNPDHKL